MVKFCDNCVFKYGWYDKTNPFPEECTKCNLVDGKPTHYMQNPNTNADRIRAMTDMELAHFMVERSVNENTLLMLNNDHGLTAVEIEALRHNVYCALLQWLQQPAEGE